jgi:uncharacterized protein YqjF (DUF2071 family)
MAVRRAGERFEYRSERPSGHGFAATCGATGPVATPAAGSLEHWLTERYCLYARSASGGLSRAEIHHAPWPLQPAEADVRRNDMLRVLDAPSPAPEL